MIFVSVLIQNESVYFTSGDKTKTVRKITSARLSPNKLYQQHINNQLKKKQLNVLFELFKKTSFYIYLISVKS